MTTLNGKKVALTGTFEELSEEEIRAGLLELGAKIDSTFGRKTDLLVAGKKPDNQAMTRANDRDAPVLGEWQVRALLDGGDLDELLELGDRGPRVFERGARVRITGGKEGVGMIGDIFWWGESKFGDGMRAGIEAFDGEKYWVDEENLGWPDEEIDYEAVTNALGKGDRVRVTSGDDEGAVGEIFWWGKSKFGDGMRAGIETDDGDTVWADEKELEKL